MSGPSLALLRKTRCAFVDRKRLERLLFSFASRVDPPVFGAPSQECVWDLWITDGRPLDCNYQGEPRPFVVACTDAGEDSEFREACARAGIDPQAALDVSAMLNTPTDHSLLASIAVALSQELQADVVDLDGDLRSLTRDESLLSRRDVFALEWPDGSVSHLMSRAAFRLWTAHPDFRMIK